MRRAGPHKFQAILKDDTDPASACPRTLLVAKTAGRKNLTRELPGTAGGYRIWMMARQRKGLREKEREKKSRREANGARGEAAPKGRKE